jgi:nucleotide-binding universal stress UspA family protein
MVPFPPPAPPSDHEAVQAQLNAIATANREFHIECSLAENEPAAAILDAARHNGCDMIVMGTHGRTAC